MDEHFQGEPLNNYPAVKAAVSMLTDGRYFSLQRQKVTVSTVGVIPKVLQVDFPALISSFKASGCHAGL